MSIYLEDCNLDSIYQSYDQNWNDEYVVSEIAEIEKVQVQKEVLPKPKVTTTQQKDSKSNYKNFPKLIGRNICKYAECNFKDPNIPKGLRHLVERRKNTKQQFTKIADLRQVCEADEQSKELFTKYVQQQLFVDLVYSVKIQNPMEYISGICNYYATSYEPQKMIGSNLQVENTQFM